MNPEATALLREAAEWRLLGLLFEYPVPEWRASLVSLLPALEHDPELRSLGEAALDHHTEGLHFALFGPSGSVPVREVTYQGGVQFGYLMAELAACYEAFGYEPSTVQESPDHLAVELGFMAFLKLKQAHASEFDQPEQALITAEAAESFLRDHIARQAEPVLQKLEVFGPDYLVAAGRRILEHAGPPARSSFPLGSADLMDDEDGCGASCGEGAGEDNTLVQLR